MNAHQQLLSDERERLEHQRARIEEILVDHSVSTTLECDLRRMLAEIVCCLTQINVTASEPGEAGPVIGAMAEANCD